ncbi:CrcB protein [Streptosporangium becharense]|uniref:Fluoride-specific ion channel FluC n=1 Tax=Streptosporangium becharense TaxID=1816182 RepID=A0A7W9MDM3_9ACTN|nr:fluoride efflux transporter CrcB [Streptosporangium becharense]MBB2915591.1 CrcB protein [Streptosporangium becharense]MBB5817032.1 CrcB protein [Streptosporangium becharense]
MTEPVDPDVELADARQRQELRRSHYRVLAVIAAGGALGTGARYAAALVWPTPAGAFPWTTLGVNTLGCLVIGVFLVTLTEAWAAPAWLRPFFATGVLGGFTTFSTYCVDIERLVSTGRAGAALSYLVATVVAALAAVTAGAWITRLILAAATRRKARRTR